MTLSERVEQLIQRRIRKMGRRPLRTLRSDNHLLASEDISSKLRTGRRHMIGIMLQAGLLDARLVLWRS